MKRSKIVGIIGSAGGYGRWLSERLRSRMAVSVLGCDPADPDSLTAEQLIERSDVLIFATPLGRTVELIEHYIALSATRGAGQLWLDLASVKQAPIEAMLKSAAEVVGLHPLTAPPKAPSLRGRILVVCEARLERWRPWFKRLLDCLEADCIYIAADDHDRRMALVQNMVHAMHLAQAAACARLGNEALTPSDLLDCRTVGFETDFATATRMLAGNAELYADILLGNPHALAAVNALIDELQRIAQRIQQGDAAGLCEDSFARARQWFGAAAIARGNYTFERVGYLLADIADPRAISVHLPLDQPGSLRQLLAVFERHGVNLDSVHSSRTPQGELHFRLGFARDSAESALSAACAEIDSSGLGRRLPS